MNKKVGFFENPRGYRCPKHHDEPYLKIFTKTIFEFTLDPDKPLTFHDVDGCRYQPDRHFPTDKGSTPQSLQLFFPKTRREISYLIHDSGYKDGGLYQAGPDDTEFVFVAMSRLEIDQLLRRCVEAEGGGIIERNIIYRGVRAGGWTKASWKHGRDWPKNRNRIPVDNILS